MYPYTYTHTHIYIYNIHTYIYIYTHTYIYTYTYIYIKCAPQEARLQSRIPLLALGEQLLQTVREFASSCRVQLLRPGSAGVDGGEVGGGEVGGGGVMHVWRESPNP